MQATKRRPAAREWRCRSCGLLLGVAQGREIEIRYKDARYLVDGAVRTCCRRCGETNVRGCPETPAAAL